MKFGPVAPDNAEGSVLAHSTKLADRTLKKGHKLTTDDCRALAESSLKSVVVASFEDGDLNEDTAAARLGKAAMGGDLYQDAPFTGRMNLFAETNGVLVVDTASVTAANRIDPAITFATLANYTRVTPGRMVATSKIIPFAVPETLIERAETAIKGAVRIASFSPKKIGLVATKLPHLKTATMDKTRRVLEDRLRPSGSIILRELRIDHTETAVSDAISTLSADGAEFLILFGASAVVDRADVLPAALEMAGGTVRHLGMPVDPGNLLMLGELDGKPVLGAPGCARSPKENGFDWILDRLLAGLDVSGNDITAMGVGGLLMEIGTRPQPRAPKHTRPSPKIAAIILGAGKSSRMGGPNKLLAKLDGKTLIRHAAEAACGTNLTQTILVTGHLADKIQDEISDLNLTNVHNPDYADGMSGSIRTGMNALRSDIDAVLILLGDMPRITSDVLGQMITAYSQNTNDLIVTATAGGKRGNPVLWDRRFFEALKSLSGDVGARHVIADNPGFVAEVDIGEAARLDLDTPEALQAAGGHLPDKHTK
ncbi:NTP transferase domain-containing protein [Roseibium sp.]|uniref:NTP transferase domain-containing protein n=1 Tax=Roseibium sp. TaxID=1936156 RepID=UPI003B5275C3